MVFPNGNYSSFKAGKTVSIGCDLLLKLSSRVKLNTGLGVTNATFSYVRDVIYFANGAVSSEDPNNINALVTVDARLLSASIPVTLNIELAKNKFIPYVNAGFVINGKVKYDETYQTDARSFAILDYMKPSVFSLGVIGGIGIRRYFQKTYVSSELTYTGQLSKMNSYSKNNWIRANSMTLSITGGFLF